MNTNRRQNTIQEARLLLESEPVYLDTETTGLHQSAEVIEIGIIDDQGEIPFEQRIRPRVRSTLRQGDYTASPLRCLRVHPPGNRSGLKAEAVLLDKRVGVYNVEFDLRLIRQSNQRTWMRSNLLESNFFDIMKLYARFFGDWDPYRQSFRYQSLEMAGRQCGIRLPNSHGAVDDCLLTRALLHYMAESV